MKIEIGYFPPEKVERTLDDNATYPFEIEGEFKYILDFSLDGKRELVKVFFGDWMSKLDYYSIYSLAEIFDFQQEEYEELFNVHKIEYKLIEGSRKDSRFVKTVLHTPHQFFEYFPYLYGNGSMLNLSLWSFKKDAFRLEEREYEASTPLKKTRKNRTIFVKPKWIANSPIVTLSDNYTIFWVGHDGSWITAFSNNEQFATIGAIQTIVPQYIELVEVEYG